MLTFESTVRFLFGTTQGFLMLFAGAVGSCYGAGRVMEAYHFADVPVERQILGHEQEDTCIIQNSHPYCFRVDGQDIGNFVERYYLMQEELRERH